MPVPPEVTRPSSCPAAVHPSAPGSVRLDWLAESARLSGKSLHLGVALAWLAVARRAPGVRLTRRTLAKWSLSRDACYDGLRRLEAAHLVQVWRLPGRAPHVILLEPGEDQPLDLGLAYPPGVGLRRHSEVLDPLYLCWSDRAPPWGQISSL